MTDLTQVAQYLAVNQDLRFPHDELIEYLRQELLRNYESQLPASLRDATLMELFATVGQRRRADDPADPYRMLAGLPLSVYITTDVSNLLAEALRAAGKEAQIELCRWNEVVDTLPSIYDQEPEYRPTPERPLVYHLFGSIDEPDSIVLTEDDYFDYLIGVSTNKDLLPTVVRQALYDSALYFIGYEVGDRSFRFLFRSLMSSERSGRRRKYSRVVQCEPQDNDRAQRYLETYYSDADISIYWGSAEDFVLELQHYMEGATDGTVGGGVGIGAGKRDIDTVRHDLCSGLYAAICTYLQRRMHQG